MRPAQPDDSAPTIALSGRSITSRWGLNWPTVALLSAFIAGSVVRCVFVGEQSLWWDEVFTYKIVDRSTFIGVLKGVKATESTPPLFYVLTWLVIKMLGYSSDTVIRLVSLIAGVLTFPAIALAFPRFVGYRVTATVAWLFAASPLMVWYSLEARSYALFIFVGALSLWSVALLCERPTQKRFALWALTGLVCVYTHYFAVFLIIAEFLALLFVLKRRYIMPCVWGLGLLILSLPLAPLVAAQDNARSTFIDDLTWSARMEGFMVQFPLGGELGTPFSPTLRTIAIAFATVGLFVGLAIVLARVGDRSKSRGVVRYLLPSNIPRQSQTLLVITLITLAIPFVLTATRADDHLFFRNLLVIWPYLAAIVAIGLLCLLGLPLLTYLVVLAIGTTLIVTSWHYEKTDWRAAARLVTPLAHDIPIITYSGADSLVASYYMKRKVTNRTITTTRVWFMIEPRPVNGAEEPQTQLPQYPPKGFTLVRELNTHGFRLLEYVAPYPTRINRHHLGIDGYGGTPAVLAATPTR